MSNKLIHMKKVKLILRLYTQGVSKKTISEQSDCTRNTVKKYIRQFIAIGVPFSDLDKLSNTELEQLFKNENKEPNYRLERLESYFPEIEKALKKKGVTREYLWQKYISENPDGYRLSQFKNHYSIWRKQVNSVMHIEHKSGDKVYVDYTGQRLEIVDINTGELRPVEVFVAILGASQLTYVEASLTQQKEDFILSCENALHYFEGVPLAIVPDNLKSAVTKSDKYEPTLNEAFRDFTLHYGMAALPAGVYIPKHKALAEGMVKIVYRTIYVTVRQKTYTSVEELNQAIKSALEDLNNRLMKGRPYSRRMLFEETERESLRPLPMHRFELKRKKIVTVMKNNHVCLSEDKHYYSVPYHYIGKKVKLFYNQTEVEVYCQYEIIASHTRNKSPFRYTTISDHLASKHQFMTDWSPEKFIERADKIGQQTSDYIKKVLEKPQHAEQAYRSCQGILSLAPKVGNDRLNNACVRANYYQDYSYKTIKTIIERKLDLATDECKDENLNQIPFHENIRGKTYFN